MTDFAKRIAALSPEKRQLLLQKLNNQKQEVVSRPQITPQSRKSNYFPLSFAQQRLWFLDQLQPGNTAFNLFLPIHLIGVLNVNVLEQSFREVIRRHEGLRTTFTTVNGQPVQVIAHNPVFNLSIINLQELSLEAKKSKIAQLANEEVNQPFDLAKLPLLRVTLLKLTDTENILFLTIHHIISDGWSINVLTREMATLYEVFSQGYASPLPELSVQYVDFAVWQRQLLQGEEMQTHLNYWQQQLGSELPILNLPSHPRPKVQTYNGDRQPFILPIAVSEALKAFSQQENITLFMTILAVFQVLLHWYTKEEDIVIGTDIANRNQVETKEVIGFFINQLVLRTDLSGNPTFLEILKRVRDITLQAYAHQDLPFDKLVEVLNPERSLNHAPLFQTKLVFEVGHNSHLELPNLTISPLPIPIINDKIQLDLILRIKNTQKEIIGAFEYNTDLFAAENIALMQGHFLDIINQVVAHPETKLNELVEMLTAADNQQKLIQQNQRKQKNQQKLQSIKRKTINFT
ncbi:MAG: condensation domain-containing protein [Aulosira sp. DedQUE10]|nr:condensation domain-containing protein [Aulosira sp. DedQUE10]